MLIIKQDSSTILRKKEILLKSGKEQKPSERDRDRDRKITNNRATRVVSGNGDFDGDEAKR
jgi:hypothetical protein